MTETVRYLTGRIADAIGPTAARIFDPAKFATLARALGYGAARHILLRDYVETVEGLDIVDGREADAELRRLAGEIASIETRRRVVARLKARYQGLPIPDAVLDRAIPPVPCRRTRERVSPGRTDP